VLFDVSGVGLDAASVRDRGRVLVAVVDVADEAGELLLVERRLAACLVRAGAGGERNLERDAARAQRRGEPVKVRVPFPLRNLPLRVAGRTVPVTVRVLVGEAGELVVDGARHVGDLGAVLGEEPVLVPVGVGGRRRDEVGVADAGEASTFEPEDGVGEVTVGRPIVEVAAAGRGFGGERVDVAQLAEAGNVRLAVAFDEDEPGRAGDDHRIPGFAACREQAGGEAGFGERLRRLPAAGCASFRWERVGPGDREPLVRVPAAEPFEAFAAGYVHGLSCTVAAVGAMTGGGSTTLV
jgi:hypothetical protein